MLYPVFELKSRVMSVLIVVPGGASHTGAATICLQTRGPTGEPLYVHMSTPSTSSVRQPPTVVP